MTTIDCQINLSRNAEYAFTRSKLCPPNYHRIGQMLDRYGMMLRNHWNDELEAIARNPWVSYCIYEWCDGHPASSFSLPGLLQNVAFEMEETGDIPGSEELSQLIEATSQLSPFDQLAIMEFVEANQ